MLTATMSAGLWRLALMAGVMAHAVSAAPAEDYAAQVLRDKPVAFWRLDETEGNATANAAGAGLHGEIRGNIRRGQVGPRPKFFPDFPADNRAMGLGAAGAYIRVADPGAGSALDFTNGDTITLEAWAKLDRLDDGANVYIVGKGRTAATGVKSTNQNYALRLRGEDGQGCLSFVFHDGVGQGEAGWHRWTTREGIPQGSWHHMAVTYRFGQPDSIRGYVDGRALTGKWDMGGATTKAPVSDDDDLWIGTAMGAQAGSTFHGLLDSIAIHRQALTPARLATRYRAQPQDWVVQSASLPKGEVRVQLFEGIGEDWNFELAQPVDEYTEPTFAFPHTPTPYTTGGMRGERTTPYLLRAAARIVLPAGEHRLVLRARTATRLKMDGRVVASTPFIKRNSSGHEDLPLLPAPIAPDLRALRVGHQEKLVTVTSKGGEHVFTLEAFVGGKGLRPETAELSVGIAGKTEPFQLLSPGNLTAFTEESFDRLAEAARQRHELRDAERRRVLARAEDPYWQKRHAWAREVWAKKAALSVPAPCKGFPAHNEVDHFINERLAKAGRAVQPLTNDEMFLRRVALDITGVVPTPEEIVAFQNDKGEGRRARAIDRLLNNPGWADHWVGYWQDVLAENPNMLKPTLNNTGPFRFWLHDALADNKAADRFVTELVLMGGSPHYGGAAGFSMAAENDAPMANKAQILGQAFLGLQMKCARCHDAPFHPVDQKELFGLAAMLRRAPQEVPLTSSVPVAANLKGRIEVTLKPGSKVAPAWEFHSLAKSELPADMLRDAADTRERLAALVTGANNERFAQVLANRLWKRYLGWGLVEPADDWEHSKPSHPELLDWLARQLVASGYDLKHLARLILNSHAYQRQVDPAFTRAGEPEARLFAGPPRRRLSGEQVVDSLFAVAGKPMGVEELNMDSDGRRPVTEQLNLGIPRRAWQFTSLSNERDRPALAIPKAQTVVDLLKAMGWRDGRQDPITDREVDANPLQPGTLANGVVGRRAAQLSDDSAFTELALRAKSAEELIGDVYQRILSRAPTAAEREMFGQYLRDGFSGRVVAGAAKTLPRRKYHAVSWSNHLSPEATRMMLEMEKEARAGDPSTVRLRADWRERLEDMISALINSPEFIFVP